MPDRTGLADRTTGHIVDVHGEVENRGTGVIDAALLAEIGTPMIPEDQYAAIVNGGI